MREWTTWQMNECCDECMNDVMNAWFDEWTLWASNDVIKSAIASQITSLTIVYSTVCSAVVQRKHQSSASLAFVRRIHRWPVNYPHKGPVTRKMFPFDDVIMRCISCYTNYVSNVLYSILMCILFFRVKDFLYTKIKPLRDMWLLLTRNMMKMSNSGIGVLFMGYFIMKAHFPYFGLGDYSSPMETQKGRLVDCCIIIRRFCPGCIRNETTKADCELLQITLLLRLIIQGPFTKRGKITLGHQNHCVVGYVIHPSKHGGWS